MAAVHTDLTSDALIDAVEANMAEFFGQLVGLWSGAESYYGDDIAWSQTELPFSIFNSTVRIRLSAENADSALRAAIARSRAKNVPVLWWVSPKAQPTDLEERLRAHGFAGPSSTPGMVMDLTRLEDKLALPDGVTIEEVTTLEGLDAFREAFAGGFELPQSVADAFNAVFRAIGIGEDKSLRHFLARLNGKPAASSSVMFAGGVAGVYNVATLPSARGQGIGRAVTAYPLYIAREAGYRVSILKSSQMGYSVYRKMGYEQVCEFKNYTWQSPGD